MRACGAWPVCSAWQVSLDGAVLTLPNDPTLKGRPMARSSKQYGWPLIQVGGRGKAGKTWHARSVRGLMLSSGFTTLGVPDNAAPHAHTPLAARQAAGAHSAVRPLTQPLQCPGDMP